MTTLATETWTGTTGAAWPAQWTRTGDTGNASTIQANRGRLTTGTAQYATAVATIGTMTATSDTDVTVSVYPAATATAQWAFVRIKGTGVGGAAWTPSTGYQLWLYNGGANTSAISLIRYNSDGSEVSFADSVAGPAWSTTSGLTVRLQYLGTTLRYKVWTTGGAEPGSWNGTFTDSGVANGKVSLITTVDGAAAKSVDWDDLTVTDGAVGAVTGTAGVSGTGTLTGVGHATVSRTSAFTGSGTLTASGAEIAPPMPRQVTPEIWGTTNAGTKVYRYAITTSDVANSVAHLYVPAPKVNATSAKLLIAQHGLDADPYWFFQSGSTTEPILQLVMDAGYVVIVPAYDNTFGNADAQARMFRAYQYLTAKWTSLGTVLFGFSMGGAASTIAMHKQTIPGVRAVGLVAPALDFLNIQASDPSLVAVIYTAYNTNAAGFSAATAAWDPQRQPATAYAGQRFRIASSPDDTYTFIRPDAVEFLNYIRPQALQAIDVQVTGDHGSAGEYVNPSALVAFYEAAIAAGGVQLGTGALSGGGTLTAAGAPSGTVLQSVALVGGGTLTASGGVDFPRMVFRTPYLQRRVPVIAPVVALMNFSVAVLRIQGQWVETEWPSEEQIKAADYYFPGGYEIPVDPATAAVLIAAGYTVDMEN